MISCNLKDKKILVIEPDEAFRKLLCLELAYRGFQVEPLAEQNGLIKQILSHNPDLIVLALDVSSDDATTGIALCEKIRYQGITPWIITLSRQSSLSEKIQSLEAGADDYFGKPFASDELIAKMKAMLRRTSSEVQDGMLLYHDLRMNLINRSVWRGKRQIELRSKEFELLRVFMLNAEEVLSRQFIFDQVWGSSFLGDSNVIEVYIRYLRSKLDKPNLIKTKRGNGYIMISDEAQISRSKTNLDG
ncbi:MAG: response regulator transcription factor [Candidatus Caenarcaniphilales bacterium]|nr:response regulator transcription factor [Candidatus Caenarcaniphilales bacterium]